MAIDDTTFISMSYLTQRDKKHFGSSTSLNFSWPIDGGRNSPQVLPVRPKLRTRPRSAASKHCSADDELEVDLSWYSDDSSSVEDSDASTRRESNSSDCSDCSSGEPSNYWMEQNFASPDKLPTQEKLNLAGEVQVFDGNGIARTFKSLYQGCDAIGEQQLFIFVRHFLCTGCQQYLKTLQKTISMKQYFSLPVPTSITIIGLGDPKLIPFYRRFTGTKFPIFTDPSRSLHRHLGMTWSLNIGKRPQYAEMTALQATREAVRQTASLSESHQDAAKMAGGYLWVGGEFLIKDGKAIWCHRMKNYRDHTEMDVLTQLLGVEP